MKRLKKICAWGGVSALIVALVASLCLMALPARGAENNEFNNTGVVRADTELYDGFEYLVFDVYNDTDVNDICTVCNDNNYVKLVLREDRIKPGVREYWGNAAACGHAKIIDLNGYTLSLARFDTNARWLEIWDSSAAQTGQIICTDTFSLQSNLQGCNIRGGTIKAPTINYYGIRFHFYGGRLECERTVVESGSSVKFSVQPYVTVTYDEYGRVLASAAHDYYAVSPSDLFSGAYNNVYGCAWELNAKQLYDLAIPTDQTYYLWGRNRDGGYEYLNLCYIGGKWVTALSE